MLEYPNGVSVIIPTWRRSQHLGRRLSQITRAINDCELEIILVFDEDDPETLEFLENNTTDSRLRGLEYPAGSTPGFKWNQGAKIAKYKWLLLYTDDVETSPDFWPGYNRLPATGVLGFHDDKSRGAAAWTVWIATREWLCKYFGGCLFPPIFKHQYGDLYIHLVAVKNDQNIVSSKIIGEHVHSFDENHQDLAMDDARKRAHIWRDDGVDIEKFYDLKRRGFPVGLEASPDWKPLW